MNQLQELRERDLQLKQSLGQNFMLDATLCAKIVRAAQVVPGDAVLEIGPGLGALTSEILAAGGRVFAVELDQRFLPALKEKFPDRASFNILHADILKVRPGDIPFFTTEKKIKVISNLPFYNASQILFLLAEWREKIDRAVITLQKEMAERLAAAPGGKEYGVLSIRMQALSAVRLLFSIDSSVFFPRPKIAAAAVLMDFGKGRLPADLPEEAFARCVRTAFGQRRKMLSNTLGGLYGRAAALAALAECGIEPSTRAERLSVEDFFRVARALEKFSSEPSGACP